jgi:YggT family protein
MTALLDFVKYVLQLYVWLIIISAVLSWLIAFNVVNTQNRFVYMIADALYRLTEPALRPIRAFLPNFGGIDISPIILILVIFFIQSVVIGNCAQGFLYPLFCR